MLTDPRPRVFISYVREDANIAKQIHDYLRREGFRPWLDTEKIRVGEDWREAINGAIRESTFVVALLSRRSLAKRGYAQRELRIALDILSELPFGETFLL